MAFGQHHNRLVSPASRPLTNKAQDIIPTIQLHTRRRIAAKETSERCAHAFIARVTLSQEPAREGRGFPAHSELSRASSLWLVYRRPGFDACVTGMGGLWRWAGKSRAETTVLAVSEVSWLKLWRFACFSLLGCVLLWDPKSKVPSLPPPPASLPMAPALCPRELLAAPLPPSGFLVPLAPFRLPFWSDLTFARHSAPEGFSNRENGKPGQCEQTRPALGFSGRKAYLTPACSPLWDRIEGL